MSSYVVRLVCLANGQPTRVTGKWLRSWDVSARDGRGEVNGTDNLDDAYHFDTAMDAFVAYNESPAAHPLRPDGEPNKPMTAFTIEVMTLERAQRDG